MSKDEKEVAAKGSKTDDKDDEVDDKVAQSDKKKSEKGVDSKAGKKSEQIVDKQ